MVKQENVMRIVDYQPTPMELEMLAKAELNLAQVLAFNQPSAEELAAMMNAGTPGLVGAILSKSLRGDILDIVSWADPYASPMFPAVSKDEKIKATQQRAIETLSENLEGNPYPGKGFSKQQGEQALALIKSRNWNGENIASCLQQIRELVNPPETKI
jgi:hypothetical protein